MTSSHRPSSHRPTTTLSTVAPRAAFATALALVLAGVAPTVPVLPGVPAGHGAAQTTSRPTATTTPAPTTEPLATAQLDGLRFRNIGPAVMSGRIVDLAVVESDPTKFYVASATGGVFKTADNGITLAPVFESERTHSVGAIAVHQVDTATVWVGTGERANRQSSSWGDGVYRSDDGGATWTHAGLPESRHIGRIALHPADPDIAYVAAMGNLWGPNHDRGLYRTRDKGNSWTRILFVDENTGVVDVALDPDDPQIVYAAAYQRRRRPWGFHGGGPGSALYRSMDGGDTWERLSGPGVARGLPEGDLGRIGISVYRSDPRIVYASVEQGWRYNASTAYTERRAGVYRSDDRGDTWEHMSDWNPRPMYASQILVDPGDDQRVYMVNSYSFSDDGGRTFRVPPQSLHGDDRLVWVNPADSRHVMKADDGGLGISYDRGLHWLYISDLPVSQYYRVAVDMATPYNVYGGLQDNGSWMGPSETLRSAGILNGDWTRLGGGDGFLNLPDTTNNAIVYTASQYLGLSRFDLRTGERTAIRPGNPRGHIAARRNWTTWKDIGTPEEQRLGNAMAPANWDGPFMLSPHDVSTLYAGTDVLWKTTDRGDTWQALGKLTSDVDRRSLPIMGQMPGEFVPSLDDGIPYYPTISAIAESPLTEGLLYAGTNDGRLHVSQDGGERWTLVPVGAFSGLPEGASVSGLEPSRHREGRAYVVWNNYRNGDFGNYLYRSDDYGRTWEALANDFAPDYEEPEVAEHADREWILVPGNLPPQSVLRTVREDPRNESVLYLGAEVGLFYSMDGGARWTELRGGLPTLAFNDLVVHPRDNDLVVGTHGRGVWILDQINALQELSPEVAAADAHLFTVEPAIQWRRAGRGVHAGDVHFQGENPPVGALFDYWLAQGADSGAATLVVEDMGGQQVAVLEGGVRPGVNRVVWDLRHQVEPPRPASSERGRRWQGPLVVPGEYAVRLVVEGTDVGGSRTVEVRDDPRIEATPAVRAAWTADLLALAEFGLRATDGLDRVRQALEGVDDDDAGPRAVKLRDLGREFEELESRIRRLANAVEGAVAPPTGDQRSRRAYYMEMLTTLETELEALPGTSGGR